MNTIRITRVYTDGVGESCFEDIEMLLHNEGEIGFLSKEVVVKEMVFRKVKPTYDFDFHNAPAKQYIILLDGEIEIETSRGEKRIFKGGEILLMEDTAGKGHKTKNLQDIERRSVFITI